MKICLLALLCLAMTICKAQRNNEAALSVAPKIVVTLPINGAVYQRNAQNKGILRVIGNFTGRRFEQNSVFDGEDRRVTAWLDKLDLTSGSVIPNSTQPSVRLLGDYFGFRGDIEADAGWYRLTIRETVYEFRDFNDPTPPRQIRSGSISYQGFLIKTRGANFRLMVATNRCSVAIDRLNGTLTKLSEVYFTGCRVTITLSDSLASVTFETSSRPKIFMRKPCISYKVGIGDVFLIGGQSNAQGLPNSNPAVATQFCDAVRVSPNRFTEADVAPANPTTMPSDKKMFITKMVRAFDESQFIGPTGNSLWYWALVGQNLVNQNQVPIAFHNVAWGGTFITSWAASINPAVKPLGWPDPGKSVQDQPRFLPGTPFSILRNAIQFYASTYGLRSVLWMQGETDTKAYTENWAQLSTNLADIRRVYNSGEYATRLLAVIQASRLSVPLSGYKLPWVVARTSYNEGNTNNDIVTGQNQVISPTDNIFYGPETDIITGTGRLTGFLEPTHLSQQGLGTAAQLWTTAIK